MLHGCIDDWCKDDAIFNISRSNFLNIGNLPTHAHHVFREARVTYTYLLCQSGPDGENRGYFLAKKTYREETKPGEMAYNGVAAPSAYYEPQYELR